MQATMTSAPNLYVRLLGSFSVTINGRPVQRWRAGKARSLFQYLVVHRDRLVLRDKLYQVLWPYREWSPGSSSLKVAMHALRQILEVRPDGTDASGVRILHQDFGYVLYADRLWVDVDQFESCIADGRAADQNGDVDTALSCYAAAMEFYTGDFLAGESADWIVEHREWCKALALRALDRLSTEALNRNDFAELLRWCRRMIGIDPYREETYQRLMTGHARLGDVGAVHHWYQTCVRRLRDDLGVEPSLKTQDAFFTAVRRPNRPRPIGTGAATLVRTERSTSKLTPLRRRPVDLPRPANDRRDAG